MNTLKICWFGFWTKVWNAVGNAAKRRSDMMLSRWGDAVFARQPKRQFRRLYDLP